MRIKLVVAGSNTLAKRNLLINFKKQEIEKQYIPVVIDNFFHTATIDGKQHEIVLWDTSGTEAYPQARKSGYRQANAFLLVYSDVDSFSDLFTYHKEISRTCPGAAIMLVSVNMHDQLVNVSPEIGKDLAKVLNIPFLQCDIENLDEINLMFKLAMRQGVDAARQMKIQQGLQLWHDPVLRAEPEPQKSYQTDPRLTRSL